MILVYVSIGILIVSAGIMVQAIISFKKKTEPTFSFFSSVGERMQEENDAIQEQVEQMKHKQDAIKNDLDWKKSVFLFTLDELKKLPNTFKSNSKQKFSEYERGM
ncbi:hypothetical protein M3936_00275 [Sutcliffiella horikoshii]|uniref:hypothetical protein n=1 Tax=Sutcliffiella horikoshii TaxID=79883 RepID=UPI0007D0587C|nr:hypothetical protein [Sutcliffiella horikoshii]MCM3616003.1 hypothetical protein [Sutcliffiella horikoshii]